MMTREHHRRRSPESSRRRRKERRDSREQLQNQQIALPAPPPEERNELIHLRSRATSPLSSSSSTSSSLVNISRPSRGFGLGAFFGGGGSSSSSKRKQHRVKKKRSRFLRFGNSSSSSVGSDLAYGKGYVERRRSREFSPPSSSAGRPRLSHDKTDEEILELGRKFAEIARQQNAEDLKAAGRSRPSTLVSAATVLSQFRRTNSGNSNRGVGSSKPRLDDSSDDSEWESASEDESSSEFDSGLAYGSSGLSLPNTVNEPPPRQSTPRSSRSSRSPRPSLASVYGPPLRRKSSVVDPKLFGPINSLRGYVDAPCGFDTVDRSTVVGSPRPYEPPRSPSDSVSVTRPLQTVYPVPTSDPNIFGVSPAVSSQQNSSAPLRPEPVPIQHPRPITRVPTRVLDSVETDSEYSERVPSKREPPNREYEDSAIASLTTTVLGSTTLGSDRKDDRNKYEGRRDHDAKRRSKRSDVGAQAEKDEKDEKLKNRDDPLEARIDQNGMNQETRPEYGLEHERNRNWEKLVPEIKRKFEEEGRRRDEYSGNNYDKPEDSRKNERKVGDRDVSSEKQRDKDHVNGPEYPAQEGPIDPFQFQVADDAFQTPLFTTPKRPLTPNVITVDREPNFSPDSEPSERLSRRDSYERELRDALEIYKAAEHATAPVSGTAFAAAAAAEVMAEERRGRSHSRGGDASSRNRSRREESPKREKDVVQEDANRYYREAELARRIKNAETRDAEPSVVGKWGQGQESTIVDVVSPPEMDHPKQKSPYDAPDADVRVDNVLDHPNQLSRFQTPHSRGLAAIPVFTARDPSAERERPMLNIVRPTPIPTPIPEGQQGTEEPRTKLAKKIDIPPPEVVPDVVIETRTEVPPAPSIAKSVSWGENQTKRYVVESPEREDDPYSGTKIVTPAKAPRARTSKRNAWGLGFIAATLGGGSSRSTQSTSERTVEAEASEPRKPARNADDSANRRASAQFKNTHDSPPIPGPKPPPKPSNLKGAQVSGTFAEDPVFTANIAAALEGSGFDPNIVINDANFHKRDSPPRPDDFGGYRAPFVESVTDLGLNDAAGVTSSGGGREHGFVIGEVSTPSDERDIPTDKSQILSELNRAEQHKLDKTSEQDSTERRQVTRDDKLGKGRDLESEFMLAKGQDTSPKKKLKKSKRPIVVQDDFKQSGIAEAPRVVVPADAPRDVHDVYTTQLDNIPNRLKENDKGAEHDWEIYDLPPIPGPKPRTLGNDERKESGKVDVFSTPDDESDSRQNIGRYRFSSGGSFSRTVLPSELSTASSYGIIDTAESTIATEEEWDMPKKKGEKKSKRDDRAYDSPSGSAPISDASPLPENDQRTLRKGKKSKHGSIDDEFAFPAARDPKDQDARAPIEVLYDSPKEMTESISDVSSEKTTPAFDASTHEPQRRDPKQDKRSTPADIPRDENNSIERGPTDKGDDRSEVLDRDINFIAQDQTRYIDNQRNTGSARGENVDDAKSVASTLRSAGKKDRKGSKSETDRKGSGSTSFFGRLKSSIGIADEKQPLRKLEEDKNESFLGSADIHGAGAGLTGDAILPQESLSNANNAPSDEKAQTAPFTPERQSTLRQKAEPIDPDIVPREIRPAIDPKHGDFLPLPPSRPVSPLPKLSGDFPPLPDSRPETPDHERHLRETPTHTRRRSTLETPKTPSQSAIPIQFFRPGHRHTPSNGRSSPSVSPITATVEFGGESKNRSRPASWEGSRDFKPLFLLQRALRGSVDLSGSPERESSPSGSEARERGSPSSTHLFLESPDRDRTSRDNIFSGPMSSPIGISVDKPESSHAAEKVLQLSESPLSQMPNVNEALLHRIRADSVHLSPLPEESDLKPAEEGSPSPFSSPTFLVAANSKDQGGPVEDPPKDNLKESTIPTKGVAPVLHEPEIMITPDDHSPNKVDEEVVPIEAPRDLLPVTDSFAGIKTPDSVDTFDTALSNADDREPLQSSDSLDKTQDNESSIDELLIDSANLGVTPLQDEALSGVGHGQTLPTEQVKAAPIYIPGKDESQIPEQDEDDNMSIETLVPETSIPEAREEQLPIETQESDKAPVQLVEDIVPPESNLKPIRKSTSTEDNSTIVEGPALSREEPTTLEPKTPEIEGDSPTVEPRPVPTPELAPTPSESVVDENFATPEAEIAVQPETSTIELGTPSIKPEHDTVELETTTTGSDMLSAEPSMTPKQATPSGELDTAKIDLGVKETHAEGPKTSDVQKDIPATEAKPAVVESETPIVGLEEIANPEPIIPQNDLAPTGTEAPAAHVESTIVGTELDSKQEPALTIAEPEEPEQFAPTPEAYPSASEEDVKKERDMQLPSSDDKRAESPVSVEEAAQETSVGNPSGLSVGPQAHNQEQLKAASQELHDGRIEIPKETPSIIEASAEEMKSTALEPEVQAVDEQIPARGEEDQLLSKSLSPAVQTEHQQLDTPVEEFMEAPTSPVLTEGQSALPTTGEPSSGHVKQILQEPKVPSEANRGNEETPSEVPTPSQPIELALNSPTIENHDDPQPTISEEQPQSMLEPVSEEIRPPGDSMKPKLSNVDREQYDEQPSLAEASPQRPSEHQTGDSELLENTNVDESSLQRDILDGEDIRDKQGPVSTDAPEAPLSKPDSSESSEDKQDKSAVPPQVVEEASGVEPATDDTQPPSSLNEVVNDEVQEMAQSQDELNSKKGTSKGMRLDTSDVVDTSIATVPSPEPVPQEAPSEADTIESQAATDVLQESSQNLGSELGASVAEEHSTAPQSTVEVVQEPVLEKAEPTTKDVSPEADNSGEESGKEGEGSQPDTVDAPDAAGAPASSVEPGSEKSVVEPTNVETEADSKLPSPSLAPQVDAAAVTQVEHEVPEPESTPSKEDGEDEKLGSTQIETVANNTPQEIPEALDTRVVADKELISPTQPTIERISDDMQVIIAEEETNVSPGTDQLETDEKSENTHTNAEETPASVISPEVSAEPSAIPEDTVRAGEESDPDLAAPSIERPEKDGEEHQSAQLPEQIEKHSTEVPPATVSEAPVTNSDRVSIDVSLPSDTRPEPEDHSHGTSDNIGEATKTEQEPSQDQPVEPLDQLTEPIEATTQSNAPDDIQSGLDSKDIEVSTTAEEPTPEKDTNDSEGIPNGLLVGSLPNDKSDGAQKTPGEVIPAVQGSANDSIPIKADVIQDPSTQDVPQVIPSLPPQDNSPTEASPPVALETQDKSEQPTDGMTDDSVLATSQVDESTEAMPISAEDDQPSPAEHMNLGDMQVGPSLLADNKSQTTIEVLPTIEEEGESEGQETPQETPEPTMGAAVPVDEASIEVLSSGPVEIPPTIPQDQTNPGEVTPEAPTIAKSEESVSQPHQDDPQNPITEDKGKGKEISPVQEQKPESSPLPIETPTEQPQAPIPESNQPQDVMPVDSHPVQEEIKTEPHLTEQDTSGPPDIPTPGTSKTAAGTIESSPSIKEPEAEPRPSDVTGTTLQSQNSEQEPGVQTDKAGDDVLITRPEIAPSGEVINVQDQEKTRQTRNLTENAMLEEEPVAEYVRDDESLESMVTSRPKKIKKRKKRGTQSILDGTASIPSQDPTECISSMPAAADESVNPTKSAMPTISEEFFPLPSDRVDEPIETALMIAQQDIPNSYTDTQPIAADAKEISEAEPTSPKSVSIDKESEENKLTPLDDVLPEQSLEKPAEESLAVLPIYEQGESHTLAPTEASMEESLENLILPKRDTEEEAKRDNIYDENTPEAETSQVSMGTIGNSEQMEIDASNPPQSPRGADIIDFGDVENKEDIEIKDVGHSDDVQSQEQNQAGFESAIRPDISEPPEIENIAIESLKDEKINEVVPTKKSKKSKKKQRASLREDETTLQQEPAQPIGDPIASTATAEQIDTANPFIQEDLADQDATDLMRAQNDEEKGASIQKPESETQMPTELEPDFIPQELRQPESSIEVSSTSVPPTSVQDTVPVEETEPTGLPGAPAESADTDEAPNLNIQDSRPSADNLSIAAPTQVVEEQVHGDSIPESDIPLLDQFPAENITVPIIDKLDTEDTARLDTVSQVPEQQTDILSSLSQEPASQDLEQLGEKHEEVKELIASDTLAGDVQPETSVPKEAIQAQDLLKQESIRPGETIASEELIKQEELPELEELPGIEEPIQQSEPEQPASVSQEPLQTEVSVQEEPAQTNESAQRSEPENFPREEAPTRLERSVTPAPEFPVVLDEIDSTPTKKSRKNKKKKKASQAEPDHISEIVQPIEPPGETVPPEQSVKQPIEPYAGQRTSWGFFGGLTDSFRDLLGIQEPTVASKDNKNAEGSPVTKPRSKMEENGASEPETGPTPKTVPSLESAEQSSMLEQPQESQQPADQPTSDDTPAIVTDAVSEDVSPEVTASKKSKKKKKKASQASQEPESSNTASLETQEQLIPPEEPSIQESQEQPDALSKAEEVKAVKEKAKPREDVTQSSGSKMSKKERRKMKKLAALAAELFQPEPNSNANDEPMARKPVPSPSEQPSEPVNPTSKAQTAPTTSVASIEPQEESLQPILEAESSTQPIQERIGDLAERKDEEIDVPTILEDSPAPISEQAPISFETDNTNKDAPSDSIVNATSEVARDVQEPKENLPDVTIGTREEEQDTRVFSTPNLDTKPSDSDSDPQPWGLPEAEKQNETTTNMELLLSEEQPSEESVKRPRASTPGQQELPTNQRLDAEPSLSKELEPPSPSISRKKAKKDRKKKRLSAQAGLETGSGSQTPVSQGPNISNGSGDITTGDPTAQGPERTTVNEA
ncbi:hypothetical protein F5Y11DRAFT_247746 [Daldinia sp. FL1419]|nr:hypothetical protein F5Y11DRAFT_247746 [Daldinia sp. FL1419]